MNWLDRAIKKNIGRLSSPPYTIKEVFQNASYDWQGDWEGRALLAFAMHARMGEELPCMKEMLVQLPARTRGRLFFGNDFNSSNIDEQQLAGHNWLLRGLLSLAESGVENAKDYADRLVKNLYLPALGEYENYPVERSGMDRGRVSGSIAGQMGGWSLSTDVGCVFISLDGLAEYYKQTGDPAVCDKLKRAIAKFEALDFVALRMQTHATLSALRGVLTFYETTQDERYLKIVLRIFDLYVKSGMTLTYENFNWFGREDSWTEPCAVVDSLILAIRLYRITGREEYRTLARRICFNGLRFCQRENGGAGPNTCVTKNQPYLQVSMYEAPFCCTMRYAEGLYYLDRNRELFQEASGAPIVRQNGCYFRDDRLLVSDETNMFMYKPYYAIDGLSLIELPSLNDTPEENAKKVKLRVYME